MKELFFETIDSTNTYLKQNYENLDNFTFVRADLQTSGRGRSSRKWLSKKGDNLLFSLLIKDKELINKYKSLSINSAYLVLKILEEYGLKNLSLKWPNDIYANDKKICGILLESVSKQEIECLIIGIGLNVNQKEFDGDYLIKPTSMINELNKEIDLIELKNKIFNSLLNNLNKDYYTEIIKYDYLKNKIVNVVIHNENKTVKVLGINKDYSLKIVLDEEERDIYAGEISFHVQGDY